jgi:hypothetical protein
MSCRAVCRGTARVRARAHHEEQAAQEDRRRGAAPAACREAGGAASPEGGTPPSSVAVNTSSLDGSTAPVGLAPSSSTFSTGRREPRSNGVAPSPSLARATGRAVGSGGEGGAGSRAAHTLTVDLAHRSCQPELSTSSGCPGGQPLFPRRLLIPGWSHPPPARWVGSLPASSAEISGRHEVLDREYLLTPGALAEMLLTVGARRKDRLADATPVVTVEVVHHGLPDTRGELGKASTPKA